MNKFAAGSCEPWATSFEQP